MVCSIELTLTNLFWLSCIIFAIKKLQKIYQSWKAEKLLKKWNSTTINPNKVILHSMWRAKTLPTTSPYGLKLETYLRMAKIPYELDTKDSLGPKGKLPWITYNGTHISDSHLCIQFLNEKFSVNLNNKSNPTIVAAARACRIMLEEHFLWGMSQYRWVESTMTLALITKVTPLFKFAFPYFVYQKRSRMEANGIGLHTPTQIYQVTEDDLRTVSTLLGEKKFLGGEMPCEEDCSIFAFVAQAVWALPGSSFEKLVDGELSNLKEYCERIQQLCWPDWNHCLDK